MSPEVIPPAPGHDAPVLRLLREVARRADAIALRHGGNRRADRNCWLRAEQEVFERLEGEASHGTRRRAAPAKSRQAGRLL